MMAATIQAIELTEGDTFLTGDSLSRIGSSLFGLSMPHQTSVHLFFHCNNIVGTRHFTIHIPGLISHFLLLLV